MSSPAPAIPSGPNQPGAGSSSAATSNDRLSARELCAYGTGIIAYQYPHYGLAQLAMPLFNVTLGVAPAQVGAVLMFGGLILGLWAQRRGTNVKLKAVDGNASRTVGGSKAPKAGGFTSRMEERWRRRRDNGDIF